jgi:hypothetical protein
MRHASALSKAKRHGPSSEIHPARRNCGLG